MHIEALENKIEVDPADLWILHGFEQLSASRDWTDHGMPLPVKLSEAIAWTDLMEIVDRDSKRMFCLIVQLLDHVWMSDKIRRKTTEHGDSKTRG